MNDDSNLLQDVANMLTRPSCYYVRHCHLSFTTGVLVEHDISIAANRKAIQLKQSYLQGPFNIPAGRARALAVVASVETGLGEKSVKGFLVTLTIELTNEKRLTEADATILKFR